MTEDANLQNVPCARRGARARAPTWLAIVGLAGIFLFGAFPIARAAEVRFGQDLFAPAQARYESNVYFFGRSKARFSAQSAGDVVLFAQDEAEIADTAEIAADALVAGTFARASGTTTGDVRLGGLYAEAAGRIEGDAVLAAVDTVRLAPNARVGGDVIVWSGWGKAEILGSVAGNATIIAPRVTLGGSIAGTTSVKTVARIEIAPGASLAALVYPKGSVVVFGEGAEVHKSVEVDEGRPPASGWRWMAFLAGLWLGLVFVGATAARLVFPGTLSRAQDFASQEFVWSSLTGAVVVFGFLPLSVSLALSGIGALVGVAAFAFFLFVLATGIALVGPVGGAWLRERWLAGVSGDDWRWVIVASFFGAALLLVPLVGWVVWVALWFAAVGSLTRALWARR
ncbi:MAG: hypothetical protein KatS3mg100_155 [Candidatus Parcubacteria bacterium]|nr:MAG: hypothetical protein KatS3mg100_155 [Candidatus Parcubacteria bacterium]